MRNLIVDVNRNGKHFLVGITLNYQANGIEINSVSGLFPKESHEWIKWIQDGKAIRIDQKDKVQNLINSLRTNPAESERIGLNLNAVANVVENFENPSIEEENLSDRNETLFREGEKKYTVEPVQYTAKSGKVLDMFLLKFDEQLTEEQDILPNESENLLYPSSIKELERRISQVSTGHNSLLNATSTASADKDNANNPNSQEAGETLFREGDSIESFDACREAAIENRGTVVPGLNDAVVEVVNVPKHEFTGSGSDAIAKAKEWAKNNLVGSYANSPIGEYEISESAVSKYLSKSASGKSDNLGVHLAALTRLSQIISSSILAETHADYVKRNGKRDAENGVNENMLVHRMYGTISVDGKMYRVKTTMQEFLDENEPNRPHAYEVTKIELLDAPMKDTENGTHSTMAMTSDNSIPATKLLQGVEKSYDKGVKILDESENLSDRGETSFREKKNTPLSLRTQFANNC